MENTEISYNDNIPVPLPIEEEEDPSCFKNMLFYMFCCCFCVSSNPEETKKGNFVNKFRKWIVSF